MTDVDKEIRGELYRSLDVIEGLDPESAERAFLGKLLQIEVKRSFLFDKMTRLVATQRVIAEEALRQCNDLATQYVECLSEQDAQTNELVALLRERLDV